MLKKLFEDPAIGLTEKGTFYKKLVDNGYDFSKDEVDEFYKHNAIAQRFTRRVVKDYFPIYSSDGGAYQADLTFFDKYKNYNKGYEAILCMININTRKAYCKALKKKNAITVGTALIELIIDAGDVTTLTTDSGTEFLNDYLRARLQKLGVKHLTTFVGNKNTLGKVERFNGTIRNLINKYLRTSNGWQWYDVLDDLVQNYNNTIHRSIKTTPNKANEMKIINEEIKKTQELLLKYDNLVIGDYVRFKKMKEAFKKDNATFSKRILQIVSKDGLTYKLEGMDRPFKSYELLKVDKDDNLNLEKVSKTKVVNERKIEKKQKQEPEITEMVKVKTTREGRRKKKIDDDFIYD
jgi:hypothetical protein